jgi:outer membrane protein OmpA-like peptidoglycan-associated protein
MKAMLNTVCCTAGAALILLSGCVSSKKYKASEADVAKLKTDSTQLAQQVSTLNGNVQDLQSKNTTLQGSLAKSNSSMAAQQEHLNYYQNYFKDQQNSMNQVSDDLKGALTQAGISNADVEQVNGMVYVRLDENELFKKNSNMMSPSGKKALDGLSQVIANRTNVNVVVAAGDSAMAGTNTIVMDNSAAMDAPKPVHHHHHHVAATSTATTVAGQGSTAANTPNGTAPAPKKIVHHHYNAEGGMAMSNMPGHHNRSWALKQGRMVTVANHFLKSGVPKINVRLQQPPADGTQPTNTIKVIFTPKMDNFNPPQSNSSASLN